MMKIPCKYLDQVYKAQQQPGKTFKEEQWSMVFKDAKLAYTSLKNISVFSGASRKQNPYPRILPYSCFSSVLRSHWQWQMMMMNASLSCWAPQNYTERWYKCLALRGWMCHAPNVLLLKNQRDLPADQWTRALLYVLQGLFLSFPNIASKPFSSPMSLPHIPDLHS